MSSVDKNRGFGFKFPKLGKSTAEKLWEQYTKILKDPQKATDYDRKLLRQYQKQYKAEVDKIGKDIPVEMRNALSYGVPKEPKEPSFEGVSDTKLQRFTTDLRDEAKGLKKYDSPPDVERKLRFSGASE